ncbi:hypothetical protein L207DRAFT_565532 [Hyaloscypha variabilis F]|uniref:Uncharacterized protein n=1 Tax=Hyaloscypha variabilis (strain UAMH 11265 / GT02V1 / F) TaxID=1149755 RepID=A0A2J6RT95_HYAVF|nr:hypothetical protein L207DRAFT_565532 [Hyaloscypha variabilis F]
MPNFFVVKKFPVPKASIVLGSFVYNQFEPRQGYFDPSTKLPLINQQERKSDERDFDELRAKKATEYTLLDSDGWFKLVCENNDVKAWLEKTFMSERKTLYLVTAYRTLSNATFATAHSKEGTATSQVEAPISQDGTTNIGGSAGVEISDSEDATMHIPDEKIFEIQYRKVALRGFSSRDVDDAYLESGNRWIKLFTFRDGSANEEEEDAMEAELGGESDVPDGCAVVTEDGETFLIPHS